VEPVWIVAQVFGAEVDLWDGQETREAILARHLKAERDDRHSNAIAVGDEVEVEGGGSVPLRVVARKDRRSFLERATGDRRGQTQVIAANATCAVIVSSVAEPPFRPGLVDRWALLARRGGMTPILCLNKIDLSTQEDAEHAIAQAAIPLDAVTMSAATGAGVPQLLEYLAGTMSVMVGHSGVGKSSVLHRLVPGADAATGELSAKNRKGRHTTTSARLYPLPEGGIIIDTPGVRSVPLGNTEPSEVAAIFPEIADAPPCRFRSCTHRTEPGCLVLQGVREGTLPESVYTRYRRLLEEARIR
jgi:ribosome biogenesis GTPase